MDQRTQREKTKIRKLKWWSVDDDRNKLIGEERSGNMCEPVKVERKKSGWLGGRGRKGGGGGQMQGKWRRRWWWRLWYAKKKSMTFEWVWVATNKPEMMEKWWRLSKQTNHCRVMMGKGVYDWQKSHSWNDRMSFSSHFMGPHTHKKWNGKRNRNRKTRRRWRRWLSR